MYTQAESSPSFEREALTSHADRPAEHGPRVALTLRRTADPGGRLRAMIRREAALLASIEGGISRLDATLEQLGRGAPGERRYRARVRLRLPGRLLVGGQRRNSEYVDAHAALAEAFRALRHQLRRPRRGRRRRSRRRRQ